MGIDWAFSLAQREYRAVGLTSIAILIVLAALAMTRKGMLRTATNVTLGTLTLLVACLMWCYQGLQDGSSLALPGILVFAAILGRGRLFGLLLGFMVAILAVLALGSVTGLHVARPSPANLGTFCGMASVLMGSGFGVWLLARDLRKALARLKEENLRVIQSQGHIEFLANYDGLTGLPNRTLGRDHLHQAVAQAQRTGNGAALLHLDMDNFKTINDSLGHLAGDQMLVEASARIQRALNPGDVLCRQGGDEFLVILGGLGSGDDAASRALRILAAMAEPFRARGLDLAATASLGIALYPEDGRDFETLLQKSDTAMYQAKAAGRNTFRFFDPAMNTTMLEHLHLASALRTALENRELFLHYQPQIDLASGRIAGAEALLRWRHPGLGLIPPSTFIGVAEQSGQIGEIGKWALEEACRQARRWRDQGLDLVMSVNLSPVQFKRDDLESSLFNALEEAGLPASCIELELTESMLIEDTPALTLKLRKLRTMGLSFAIDDFGTGYSNLSYLQRFEVERLKIDQSFVRRLGHGSQDEAIVLAIIQMARSLNLSTVAEGIEDASTLERLKALGCTTGQGFLWSKAIPAEAFLELVRTWQQDEN